MLLNQFIGLSVSQNTLKSKNSDDKTEISGNSFFFKQRFDESFANILQKLMVWFLTWSKLNSE